MNSIEILIDLAKRPGDAAEQLRGVLTPELLNAHPHHDNSIAWLLWHAGREIDEQIVGLTGGESVWLAAGFAERFGLEVGAHEHGYGHTSEQARAVVVRDPELLLAYLSAAIDAQVKYVAGLDEEELRRIVDEGWEPPVTLAARLVSISVDAAEHVAQATYLTGMGPGAFED
ncbi:uncharacterized protein DUF664 [Leucobacter luti]|uniref:mycothiol transferase n=1 Tax=Leucobacter luti TaxID=340320 RepID=UPI00104CE178|nr:DUF664 domain-containing protein [Leucobacter luti]MCW2288008.1 hypothetical protein [Leucobacter luti]TCK45830.1 uncharacterized protein DUF664 [Leucobacter luti]